MNISSNKSSLTESLFTESKKILDQSLRLVKPFLAPLLIAVFPSLFLYSNNVTILILPSLIRMIAFNAVLAIGFYIIFVLFYKMQAYKAANATVVFLLFFNTYGIIYRYFLELNIFQVEHYTLLPLFVLTAIYASWLITKVNEAYSIRIWNIITVVMGALVIINIISIIPREIKKGNLTPTQTVTSMPGADISSINHIYPDIYYIVLDEFAGFDAMRTYWNNNEVNDFEEFLKTNGFFLAENSHAGTIDTLQIMATRLNYQEYPLGHDYVETYYTDIADNKVMRYLKYLGYTTIVFDETKVSFAYPASKPIIADYNFELDDSKAADLGILFDDYGTLVADNTMLYVFSNLYKLNNPVLEQHRNMIYFTVDKVANLKVPSPIFVYIHLMLPHMPFMFDADGNMTDPSVHHNWNYYLGNYIFALKIAEKLISNIMSTADPDNPQVIILQSDHGARNKNTGSPESVTLENYPEEYKTLIVNGLKLPGCDTSNLTQDINPITTFPIVFNCYFGEDIPIK
jgi:hypothetical protein